jgi:hypothetical protein
VINIDTLSLYQRIADLPRTLLLAGDHRLPDCTHNRETFLQRLRYERSRFAEPEQNLMTTELLIIQLVEKDWKKIAELAISRVHQEPETPNYKSLTDEELMLRARDLLGNLGQWINNQDDGLLNRRYESLGRLRFQDGFPLHEVVYKLQLLKRTIIDHARDQHLEVTAVELYAEQQFLQRLDLFFDRIIYRVVKGYSEQGLDSSSGKPSLATIS